MTEQRAGGTAGEARPADPGAAHPLLARLQPVFEELGLNGYQARVLLALLQVGTATAVQLARLSGVPRTSVYPVLNELETKRLISQMAGKSTSWVSPGEEVVLDRLYAEHMERFSNLENRVEGARQMLAQLAFPSAPAMPYVHVIHSAAQSRLAFEQALSATSSELLMFTRPPWSWPKGSGNETVLGTLARGVRARALYQASDLADPHGASSRAELDAYHAAGTAGRVLDELPMKLAIFDRQVALLALSDPKLADVGFPTSLLVEHPGYAALQAVAFDQLWAGAKPYDDFVADLAPTAKSP
ncbi:MAG: TrmB family transcriptional regulator, partial [Acidimicrobiales bacterium]